MPQITVTPKPTNPTDKVSDGMTRNVAQALMEGRVDIGLEKDPATGDFKAVTARTLYSTEILTLGQDVYVIDWYLYSHPC